VDLVGKQDVAGAIDAELVLGVDEDKPALGRDLPPAREQRERPLRDLVPLRFG
jgi:hypothetical protein